MKTLTFKFDWCIYEIKNLPFNNTVHLTSDRFSSPEFPTLGWELHLTRLDSSNISVWLRQIGPDNIDALVNTKYKIYAKTKNPNNVFATKFVDIAKSTYKFENQNKMGYSTISLDSVIQNQGSLHLHCEVEFDCYNLTLDLQDTYRKMLENETFSDFVIKVGDEIIKTHRCVLAQYSEVFKRMFDQSLMVEAQKGEVIISDTSPECVRAMLEFFYTGKIDDALMEIHVEGIFAIAHKYEVEKLKYICERFMASKIDSDNIVKYSNIISLYGASTLEKRVKAIFEVKKA
uniref:BTB domain-containing protein n=2 Tax=Meloidogyne TaxID=189290 RepID=A0A6V7VEI7_MELEN|nr:unnamed protein product [Meloidogyne enterolobii]